jgi:hypothetical protein
MLQTILDGISPYLWQINGIILTTVYILCWFKNKSLI